MDAVREALVPFLWLVWLAVWLALSRKARARPRREPQSSRRVALGLLAAAVLLLVLPAETLPALGARIASRADWVFWTGVGLTLAGLCFAGWARRRQVRGPGTRAGGDPGRELVTSGPYALVRHPLYAGLLLAFAGTVLARGELRGLLALGLAGLFLWSRVRIEERWLEQEFGDAYRAYAKRVAALIPFVR